MASSEAKRFALLGTRQVFHSRKDERRGNISIRPTELKAEHELSHFDFSPASQVALTQKMVNLIGDGYSVGSSSACRVGVLRANLSRMRSDFMVDLPSETAGTKTDSKKAQVMEHMRGYILEYANYILGLFQCVSSGNLDPRTGTRINQEALAIIETFRLTTDFFLSTQNLLEMQSKKWTKLVDPKIVHIIKSMERRFGVTHNNHGVKEEQIQAEIERIWVKLLERSKDSKRRSGGKYDSSLNQSLLRSVLQVAAMWYFAQEKKVATIAANELAANTLFTLRMLSNSRIDLKISEPTHQAIIENFKEKAKDLLPSETVLLPMSKDVLKSIKFANSARSIDERWRYIFLQAILEYMQWELMTSHYNFTTANEEAAGEGQKLPYADFLDLRDEIDEGVRELRIKYIPDVVAVKAVKKVRGFNPEFAAITDEDLTPPTETS